MMLPSLTYDVPPRLLHLPLEVRDRASTSTNVRRLVSFERVDCVSMIRIDRCFEGLD